MKSARPGLYSEALTLGSQASAAAVQGSVKVASVAYLQDHECITREETPHPSRDAGTPSPHGRGIEIKISALSQGRGCPTEEGR